VEKKLPETLQQLIAGWAGSSPVKLMFQDEARFGRISDIRRCWAPFPMRPLCQGMLTHEYTYAYGAVDVVTGEFDSLILPHVNTDCTQLFLDEIADRHPQNCIIMVMDGAGWHRSAVLKAPTNMRLLFLPPYAPELNPVEHIWDELREKYFHNKAFDSITALEDQLAIGLVALEQDRSRIKSIVAWGWIVNALLN
jgi:transposase